MAQILRVSDLFKFHDGGDQSAPVLKNVTFQVDEGEFVCVMGPSGSGKSTLLHLVSGLDQSQAGAIELRGKDMKKLAEGERTKLRRDAIAHVFQFFNLLPNLTVLENVGLPLAIAGKRPTLEEPYLRSLLSRVGLEKRVNAFPHQLSGGEMQRVSIARALAGGQPLILADEPTGNLSQKAGLEVMQLLRRVCEEDARAVLLVTHNPRDATFADRVLFLVDGELSPKVLRGPGIAVADVHEALAELAI
ncbi:MAG: ABC transporter ATP-binding protein [Planctomycetes bacterium]|nr:ABC transporter ATP-binding protein [Planctomycetota bacterium]